MNRLQPFITVCLLILLSGVSVPCACGQSEFAPRERVLILRNGFVLRGVVAQAGDRYIVSFTSGGEARVPVERVEMVADNMQQAYQQRKLQVQPGVLPRLRLAEWCIRHNLLAGATEQVLEAQAIDATDLRIRQVERRVAQLIRDQNRPRHLPPVNGENHVAETHVKKPAGQVWDAQVVADKPPITISNQALQTFSSIVHPLVLNKCAASACHGGRSSAKMQLIRPLKGHPASRRITQKNLQRILEQVNVEKPAESSLVTRAVEPHGDVSVSGLLPFSETQGAKLLAWVNSLQDRPHFAARPSQLVAPAANLMKPKGPSTAPTGYNADPADAFPSVETTAEEKEDKAGIKPPRDPFDPEIFNQRYLGSPPQQPAPGAGTSR